MFFYRYILFSVFLFSATSDLLFAQDTIPPEKHDGKVVVNDIAIIGNKVTKKRIIMREIPFLPGDTLDRSAITGQMRSIRENLLNTSLFNFVTVDTIPFDPEHINVLVTVAERWYTWPAPIFEVQERNFNEWWKTRNFERANYGFYLNRENFRGRKEDLTFYFQFGYTEKYGITYRIPYLDKKQRSGAGLSFSYSRNHEIGYKTLNGEMQYFKDENRYVREELSGKLNYSYRKGIHLSHYLELKYVNAQIDDTLNAYTYDYLVGSGTEMQYLTLDYFFRADYRDSRAYTLKGRYFELEATRHGFGLLSNETIDVTNFLISYKEYHRLSNRFYLASSLKVKLTPNIAQPYFVQRGLGWKDYVRAYEYYVVDAQRYGVIKLGLRYEIIKPKVRSVPLPFNKFNRFHYAVYAGIFGDAGYADDHLFYKDNPLANTLLYGYGVGIDYVTYYDVVLRFEYSMNKMLEHGFFLHFEAGI